MTGISQRITSPDSPRLVDLAQQLRDLAGTIDEHNSWPAKQLSLCGEYGVFEWFLNEEWGGQAWSDVDIVRGYLALSAACLTTTFVITQRTGACRRIQAASSEELKARLLPDLATGRTFATVGISHLTTSRRHLAKPVLAARETNGGFVLNGFSPWVTGAPFAETVVLGAALPDDRQILVVVPTDSPGISVPETAKLVGLSASRTGPVQCDRVEVRDDHLLVGPAEDVMKQGKGAKTGGLQTSTLAVGLSMAAIEFMEGEVQRRPDLLKPTESLRSECDGLKNELLEAAAGRATCTHEELRTRVNSLVLRATQAALAAAKGSGYIVGHPAGRWCREALFFLVWSCPQPVMAANLCELAGISD